MDKKPILKLAGQDGNAFMILGRARRAARAAAWDKAKIDKVLDEMMQGDYDELLQTACKYFDVR